MTVVNVVVGECSSALAPDTPGSAVLAGAELGAGRDSLLIAIICQVAPGVSFAGSAALLRV